MRNRIGKRAGRVALAIGLLVGLSGCVVVPVGPYYHPHPCCWWH